MKEMLLLAVATSIDALAVGITLAFLQVNLPASVSFIGVTTFVLSAAGVASEIFLECVINRRRSLRRRDPDLHGTEDPSGASGNSGMNLSKNNKKLLTIE